MSDVPNTRNPFLKFDGTIPAWGIVLVGIGWATYSWTTMQDLSTRLTVREISATEYRRKVDKLEDQRKEDQALWNRMGSDLQVVKELLIRLEKQFPGVPR